MGSGLTGRLRRVGYGRPVVVVSGLPRSGTSMVMQMLEAGGLGVGTDRVREGDEDNPRGYFELEKVKDLDKGGDKRWLKEYRGLAIKVISYLLRDLPRQVNYRVIFIERDLDEVLRSQKKMLERRGERSDDVSDGKLRGTFSGHLEEVRRLLGESASFDTLYVGHRDLLEHPSGEARRINDFLGGHLDESAMAAQVDRTLYRNRREGR